MIRAEFWLKHGTSSAFEINVSVGSDREFSVLLRGAEFTCGRGAERGAGETNSAGRERWRRRSGQDQWGCPADSGGEGHGSQAGAASSALLLGVHG